MVGVLRVVAGGALAAGVVSLAHCSASNASSAFAPNEDAGVTNNDGGREDAGLTDAGFSDAGALPSVLVAVHASPDLFDFRVCFGMSGSPAATSVTFDPKSIPWPYDDTHPMASSNYAGVAVGGGSTLPREIVPSAPYLIPYLIDAHTLAMSNDPKATCSARVGTQCVPNSGECLKTSDYVELPAIARSEVERGGTRVLAVVGCKTPGGAACGTAMGGALHATLLSLANAPQAGVMQLSLQIAHVALGAGPIVATLDSVLNDAGPFSLDPLQTGPSNGAIVDRPTDPGSLAWGSQGVSIAMADAGLRMSLADLQRISDPSVLPSAYFREGKSYVFVLVGDTSATNALYVDGGLNPKFDGTALHFVAISTTPPALPDGG